MPKHWLHDEVAAACKGYAKSMQNPRVGAEQDLGVFTKDIEERMAEFSPPHPDPGTWHLRQGQRIYSHLRERVFPAFQKFNKALRHIYACNPTGVTKQQKWNMVVAMYLGKVKTMDYAFKDFDATEWKQYAGCLEVKDLPKFAYIPPSMTNTSTPVSSGNGMDTADDFIETRTGICARGTRRGHNAAKAKEGGDRAKQRKHKTRERQFKEFTKSLASVLAEMKEKMRAFVLMQALKVAADPEAKKKLVEKLIEIAL